jgi:hypothetical protein
VEGSEFEGFLSRGDRRLGRVIERAWELGCKFDAWQDHHYHDRWLQAFAEAGLEPWFYTHRPRADDEIFPWDHIDAAVHKKFLLEDYRMSLKGDTRVDCRDKCFACGILPKFTETRAQTAGRSLGMPAGQTGSERGTHARHADAPICDVDAMAESDAGCADTNQSRRGSTRSTAPTRLRRQSQCRHGPAGGCAADRSNGTLRNMPRTTSTRRCWRSSAGWAWMSPNRTDEQPSRLPPGSLRIAPSPRQQIGSSVWVCCCSAPLLVRRQHVRLSIDFPAEPHPHPPGSPARPGLDVVTTHGAVECRAVEWDFQRHHPGAGQCHRHRHCHHAGGDCLGKETIIHNAACEPHIRELCNLLEEMGAHIEGVGSNVLRILSPPSWTGADATDWPQSH